MKIPQMVQIIVTTQIALIDFFAKGEGGQWAQTGPGRTDNEIKSQQLKCNTEKAAVPWLAIKLHCPKCVCVPDNSDRQ